MTKENLLKKEIEELTDRGLKVTNRDWLRESQILQMCASINALTELLIMKKIIKKEEFIEKREFFMKEMLDAQQKMNKKINKKEQSYIG